MHAPPCTSHLTPASAVPPAPWSLERRADLVDAKVRESNDIAPHHHHSGLYFSLPANTFFPFKNQDSTLATLVIHEIDVLSTCRAEYSTSCLLVRRWGFYFCSRPCGICSREISCTRIWRSSRKLRPHKTQRFRKMSSQTTLRSQNQQQEQLDLRSSKSQRNGAPTKLQFTITTTVGSHDRWRVSTLTQLSVYEKYLEPIRDKPLKMLEIGLGCDMSYGPGKSYYTWQEFLPNVDLYYIEYDKECVRKWAQVFRFFPGPKAHS
jgi:hypothetical protein